MLLTEADPTGMARTSTVASEAIGSVVSRAFAREGAKVFMAGGAIVQ
jgi:hypothetical protein